eukprot:1161310-Pelagomonas_calceolata.AAC.1
MDSMFCSDKTKGTGYRVARAVIADMLHTYAQRKGLVVNTAKPEIVHFNLKGDNVPVFRHAVHKTTQATAEYMCAPFLAGKEKKRKVYASQRLRALRKGPLTSRLARASPKVPSWL